MTIKNKKFISIFSLAKIALFASFTPALIPNADAEEQNQTSSNPNYIKTASVIVTAQKLEQPASDIPISLVVLDEEVLTKSSSKNFEDIQLLTPGFSMERQNGYNVLTMRGVGGGGRNIGFDTRVGVYLDEVYVGQSQSLLLPLYDIKQIEILRGPQGFLFGRNNVAGAVSIITKEPSNELSGSVRTRLGDYGIRESYALISGNISNNLSTQLTIGSEYRDGISSNIYNGQKLDNLNNQIARAKLILTPSEQLKINLAVDSARLNQYTTFGEPVSGLFGAPLSNQLPNRVVDFNVSPQQKENLAGANITANYTFNSGYKLTAILGYRDTQEFKIVDSDYSALDLLSLNYKDSFIQSSEEIRISSPSYSRTRYTLGLMYLSEDAKTNREALLGSQAWMLGLAPFGKITNSGSIKTDSTAVFGGVDYELTDSLTLNLGGRYVNETKKVLFNLDGSSSGAFGIGTLNGFTDKFTESKFLPSIGATFEVINNAKIYVKYSEGFKSGGWNTDFVSVASTDNLRFKSESVDSYELGIKGLSSGGKIQFDLAAYDNQYKNFQVFQFINLGGGGSSIELRNAAQARSHGIDGSITYLANDHLNLTAGSSFTDAHFTKFDNCSQSLNSCSGNKLPYAPSFSSSLSVDYTWPMSSLDGLMNLHTDYKHQGKSYSDPANISNTQEIPSRNLVNLRLGYTPNRSHWEYSLWVRNLFNHDSVISKFRDFLGTETVRRMDPRFVGLEIRYNLN